MQANVKFSKKEEKEIGKVVFVLQQRQATKDLAMKAAIGDKLAKVPPKIRHEADRRFRAAAGGSPASRRAEEEAEERTFLKIKADAPVTPNKPSSAPSVDSTQPPDPDAAAVEDFITILEDSLTACAEESDAAQALRQAAQLRVEISDSCRADTRAALQGLLDSIAGTVDRVFQEGATLVIPRSAEDIQAQREHQDIKSRHEKYTEKIRSHEEEAKQSKTVFGSVFDRGRAKRYAQKKQDLPKLDNALIMKTAVPGELRKQQRDDAIAPMLNDLKKKAKSAFAVVGGKERLHLREGIDGGVETMNIMIQGYAEKLNEGAESGPTITTGDISLGEEIAEEEEAEELVPSNSAPRTNLDAESTTTTTTTVPPSSARQPWRPGVKRQPVPADSDDSSDTEESTEPTRPARPGIRRQPARTNLAADVGTTAAPSVPEQETAEEETDDELN